MQNIARLFFFFLFVPRFCFIFMRVCVCVQKLLSSLHTHVSRSVRQDGLQFLKSKNPACSYTRRACYYGYVTLFHVNFF